MKSLKEFSALWVFVKEYKWKFILIIIIFIMTGVSEVFTGYLNGAAIEAITNMNIKMALIYLGTYLILALIIDSIIKTIGSSLLVKIENILTRKLCYYTYKKSLDLPALAFEEKSSGEIINRIISDAESLSFSFAPLLSMLTSILTSAVILVYIFINSWIIGLELILFIFILYVLLRKYNPLLKQAHRDRKDYNDKITSLVTESVRGIREIKTLGIKYSILSDSISIIKDLFNKSLYEINIRKKFNIFTSALKAIMEVSIFITCVILMYYKQINLTFFVAMTYYVYRYVWLIEEVNSFSQTYQKVTVAIGRVNEILQNKLYEDEKFGTCSLDNPVGIIEFKDVFFNYPNEEKTLSGFNLVIEPNKKIAIVGKSGQGKTTLFNLITRIFDPSEGQILLDGIDIKDLTEDSLRKNISIIRQEPFIFNRSIMDNFKLLDSNLTEKEIKKYIKMAYLDEYISTLPDKYNTVLGEGGVNLSGGQKQRLSIARTLAKKSKVILFDEATSSLDNQSQEYIKKSIDELADDHTVIIVAHRLSTIIDADIIHVVDKGKIVASGTHKQLLKNSEIYQKLYETESL
ncbi:MAG: ABC transporter ATP-binding protein [Bacilli bacterium]|nr:ABC transporter ATP-binding protein [Bacilli bacterium]